VEDIKTDWRQAKLEVHDSFLCEFAEKLTLRLSTINNNDITRLKQAGFSDRAINDAVQVIAYFNYITRIADGLCVDTQPDSQNIFNTLALMNCLH